MYKGHKEENLHATYNYILGSSRPVKVDELASVVRVDRRSMQNYIRILKDKDPSIKSIPGKSGGIVYSEK